MTTSPIDPTTTRALGAAQRATRVIANTLAARGLDIPPAVALLTHDPRLGHVLLWRMNTQQMGKLEPYTSEAVVHQISTNLRGWPVVVCNHIGLAYGVLLNGRPTLLPERVDFPGLSRDQWLMGVNVRNESVGLALKDLGHMLIAGATGSGKSTFLRLLVHQAIGAGFQLALADLDGRTFPMLAEHPALLHPLATTADDVATLIGHLTQLLEERSRLFGAAPNYPESLDEYNTGAIQKLPRVLAVLDEVSATFTVLGGPRSAFAKELATLGWRARKFGVTLVLAGQDFRKEVVGAIKESLVGPTIAFRLATAEAARNIGLPQAARLKQPGRAVTDRWGIVQTYHLPKEKLIQAPTGLVLTPRERHLAQHLHEHHQGRMSYEALSEVGVAEREARRLCADWDARGWTAKDGNRSNGRYLQPTLLALLGDDRPNRPGRPDRPNPEKSPLNVNVTESEPEPR